MSPITKLKTADHWTPSGTEKFISYSANTCLSDTSITVVPPNSHLRHPNDLFPSAFRTEILYALLISAMHVTFPSHFILFIGRPEKVGQTFHYSISFTIFPLSPSHVPDTPLTSQFPNASNEVLCVLNVKA